VVCQTKRCIDDAAQVIHHFECCSLQRLLRFLQTHSKNRWQPKPPAFIAANAIYGRFWCVFFLSPVWNACHVLEVIK